MTTRSWSYPINHDSDASFRGWGSDLAASLAAVGLVKTSDTGQINWTTVTRPGTNVYAGYEIWRYPDSSIFMKWEYGTGPASSFPSIRVQVGTGSNGSGTLTGTTSNARVITVTNISGGAINGTNRLSLMCLKDGFFGFLGYVAGYTADVSFAFFAISKTTDANGSFTNNGALVYWMGNYNAPAATQALNFLTNTAMPVDTSGSYTIIPGLISSSLVGSDRQVFVHWAAFPRIAPMMPIVSLVTSEFFTNTTFQTTVIGALQRTYIVLDNAAHGASTGTWNYKLAMLWE